MDLLRCLPRPGAVKLPLMLEIDLSHGLVSTTPQDPLSALRSRNTPRLGDVIAGLRYGARDDSVAGVVVHVAGAISVSQVEELGAALLAFRAAGKATIAWTESFGELGPGTMPYYLATHAERIWLQPSGSVGLQGTALEVMTVRGVLDKIGAEPQFGQRHEYKSAAETFMSKEITPPNREMTQRITDSVTEQIAAATAKARSLDPDLVADAIAASPMSAKEALRRGLVDRIGYRDDVYEGIREAFGVEGELRLKFAHRYAKQQASQPVKRVRQHSQPVVAVVSVEGGITTGRSRGAGPMGGPVAGSDSVTAALRTVADDDSVKAVVLRVESPGGSYVASDAIRDAVLRLRRSGRPVIASMGSVAASGGYFVAMPCDQIVALPSTLTGSIGVLGGKVVLAKTMERIGITREAIGSGSGATMFSSTRVFDHDEWTRVEGWLDAVYDDFTHKAAEDRSLAYDALEPHAHGRVWTGADAKERGLVDELGGLQTAITLACDRAGLDREHVRVAPMPQVPFLARLRPADSSASPVDAVSSAPPSGLLELMTRAMGVETGGVLTLPWRLRLV